MFKLNSKKQRARNRGVAGALPDPGDSSIALLESWIDSAPTTADAIREAEADLLAFKRDMNRQRKETGARLPYPEAEL